MSVQEQAFDVFVTGLKNAHAMEKQALSILEPQANRIENYPELRARIEAHIGETRGQIERLETIFNRLEESHSGFKDMMLSIGGSMAALSHSAAGDEVLKNTFANHAFENYEIAAYMSLLDLTEKAGMSEFDSLLEETLAEERQMAQWLAEHIDDITDRYVQLREADVTAKH